MTTDPVRRAARDLAGRRILVTGATSGIGRDTALALAARGAHVLLACRSAGRARALADEIAALPAEGTADHVTVDLADLASVRAAAEQVVKRGDPVDVMVNNAGVAGLRGVTAQGFELTFGVNHLGPFLFTTLLLDGLGPLGPGRVVTIASKAHFGARAIDFAAVRRPTRTRTGLVEYQVSKLCNVLFTCELARRCPAVDAYAVHPGVIASNIWQPIPWPLRPLAVRFMASTADGAAASLHCIAAPARELGPSGAYIDRTRASEPSAVVTADLATELWQRSEAWAA
jgi:NAD(P)-dependent dehydrogenase (short-subunit alcohol dehydrogenase family)